MRYEKPIVVNLNARATNGQDPLACFPGGTVAPVACATGANDTFCETGTGGVVYPGQDCYNGVTPVAGYTCAAGGTAGYECAAGATPTHGGVCTVGPSAV